MVSFSKKNGVHHTKTLINFGQIELNCTSNVAEITLKYQFQGQKFTVLRTSGLTAVSVSNFMPALQIFYSNHFSFQLVLMPLLSSSHPTITIQVFLHCLPHRKYLINSSQDPFFSFSHQQIRIQNIELKYIFIMAFRITCYYSPSQVFLPLTLKPSISRFYFVWSKLKNHRAGED